MKEWDMLDIICNKKSKCYVAGIHEIISFTMRIKNNKMIKDDKEEFSFAWEYSNECTTQKLN